AASWMLVRKQYFAKRSVATVFIMSVGLGAALPAQHNTATSIDTPSARYTITDSLYPDNGTYRPVRLLLAGGSAAQSGMYSDDPDELVFGYTRKMAELVERAPRKDTVLILGGGAFTMPRHLAAHYPMSQIDVVEIDPELATIAEQYFEYTHPPNVRIIPQDARAFLNTNTKEYDVVLIDVYNELSIPFSLSTVEYAAALKRAVKPGGFAAVNIIGSEAPACKDVLESIHGSYIRQFRYHKAYPSRKNMQQSQNIISVYGQRPMPWLPGKSALSLTPSKHYALTDNFAPVERLKQQCQSASH
ncbi:MAG: fused MFS/spermidine synthase, partial [Patescibacteria group bacterium]